MPRLRLAVLAAASLLSTTHLNAQLNIQAQRCELAEQGRIPGAFAPDFELGRIAALATDASGKLYVSDQQGAGGHVIHAFTPEGKFIRSIGRVGSGPAEYRALDGGLTTLSDGRLVVRDAANGRFTIFDSTGAASAQWRLVPTYGFEPMQRDRDGVVSFVAIRPEEGQDPTKWRHVAVRINGAGKVLDTLALPLPDLPEAVADMRSGENINRIPVPLAPRALWTFRPGRGFAVVQSDRPSLTLHDAQGTRRLQWIAGESPAFASGEREAVTARFQSSAQGAVRVRGPGIPERKPYFNKLWAAADGSTWVLMHSTGVARRETDDQGRPRTRWVEPLTFALVSPDGKIVRVGSSKPHAFSSRIAPAMAGDTIWIASEDDEGIPVVIRLAMRCAQ